MHHFDPETKQQSMQWKYADSPIVKKFKACPSAGKVMVTIFRDCQGVVMLDFLEPGQTINGRYNAEELERLRGELKAKRHGKLSKRVLLLQNKAQALIFQIAVAAAEKCGDQFLPHPPNSPDLAPSYYYQ